MTTIRPEAGAARAQGAAAARAGLPSTACPYRPATWLALNWLTGHALELGHRDAADILRWEAKKAQKRESRQRVREARAAAEPTVQKPARPSKPCAIDGCPGRVVWRSGRSRADFEEALYCSHGCRMAGLQAAAAAGVQRPKAPAAVARRRPPDPGPIRPPPVTAAMWRAACESMGEAEMRRFLGLDDAQVAKVLELQRRGGRTAA
jgi:hypothetical protein